MSRFIGDDLERLNDPGSWNEDDIRYLQDRGKLPEGFDAPKMEEPKAKSIDETPNTGDVGTIPDDTPPAPEPEEPNYSNYTKAQLVTLANERGLDDTGTKQEITERLIESDNPTL